MEQFIYEQVHIGLVLWFTVLPGDRQVAVTHQQHAATTTKAEKKKSVSEQT